MSKKISLHKMFSLFNAIDMTMEGLKGIDNPTELRAFNDWINYKQVDATPHEKEFLTYLTVARANFADEKK